MEGGRAGGYTDREGMDSSVRKGIIIGPSESERTYECYDAYETMVQGILKVERISLCYIMQGIAQQAEPTARSTLDFVLGLHA